MEHIPQQTRPPGTPGRTSEDPALAADPLSSHCASHAPSLAAVTFPSVPPTNREP